MLTCRCRSVARPHMLKAVMSSTWLSQAVAAKQALCSAQASWQRVRNNWPTAQAVSMVQAERLT